MAILKHKNRGAKNDRQQNCRRKWLQLDKYKKDDIDERMSCLLKERKVVHYQPILCPPFWANGCPANRPAVSLCVTNWLWPTTHTHAGHCVSLCSVFCARIVVLSFEKNSACLRGFWLLLLLLLKSIVRCPVSARHDDERTIINWVQSFYAHLYWSSALLSARDANGWSFCKQKQV